MSKPDDLGKTGEVLVASRHLEMFSKELKGYRVGENMEKLREDYRLIIEYDNLNELINLVDAGVDAIGYLLKRIEELEKELDK